ncbi:DUF6933 domain-containing protein [Geothermobacter hydrogeniphilus]|uniref:DUF6933 domain-containing protein n=1 Tax=Geothermobacter hydrogeniphilus TaxID=1969733 RepID=A0A1X0Y5F4_9BACT|nr:hypothetical protein [Geothermobacter hydrogeniphilus]ORJ60302.1 hypothetical protein B5V00_08605 [Geothermobacter hydrogeniphilus]
MIHLQTSKTFNDDLAKAGCLLPPPEGIENTWNWHAHRITLLRKKCVIVMEEASRYALIFAGLKKNDFAHFDQVLRSRIVAEASWLCDLPHPGSNEQLIAAAEAKCSSVSFSQGLDRSVQAHIRQVADELEYLVKYRLGHLPESAEEEFALGCQLNDTLRKRGGDKDYFYPLKKWRASLLALLPQQTGATVVNLADFRKGRGHDG